MEPVHHFEERYLDELYRIEHALVDVFRSNPFMNDWDAHDAIVGLIRYYQAEVENHPPPPLRLKPVGQLAFDHALIACESLVRTLPDQTAEAVLSHEELINCLKRIRKSIERWQKTGGRTTYLELISNHLP